jgi:hypothetical protein
MRKTSLALMLCVAAAAQTARYPAAIATDQDLTLQKDRAQSTLTGAMTSSATTFTVVTGSKFAAGVIVTIENEQALVCQVSGNTISVGYSACPNIDGRGYAGTSAASHYNGLPVSGNVVAFGHNALKTEIEAIEATLGTRLLNVYASVPLIASALYVFPAQTCNVSQVCSAGGASGGAMNAVDTQVTMTPVPPGVNGTDLRHRLYVSGGTGVAEACLIDGGTGTAGQTSGTIILECDHSHTGAFTISTASAGIEEAASALSGKGTVSLPKGTLNIYATMVLPTTISLIGQGTAATVLNCAAAANPCMAIADGLGTASGQGIGYHANYMLTGASSGVGLWIGGDPASVFAPSAWTGSYVRFYNVVSEYFSTALYFRRGNFVKFTDSGFSGLTRALVIPNDTGGECQPLEFLGTVLTVPSGIGVQSDNTSSYGACPVHFSGGQVSGTISGTAIFWESEGTHYETNSTNEPLINITTGGHWIRIIGGILSVHGTSLDAAIKVATSGTVYLSVKDGLVQDDVGMTTGTFVSYDAAGGTLELANTYFQPAGLWTAFYTISPTSQDYCHISVTQPSTASSALTLVGASTLVFPFTNYPIAQPMKIEWLTVSGGITAVSGLMRYTSGIILVNNVQTFVAGASIGNTITLTPFLPYTWFFDGTKIWIK